MQVEKTDVQRRYVTGSGSRSQQAGDSADQGLSRPGTLVGFPMSHLQRADSASRGRRSPCPPPTTCHRELPAAISLPGCPWTMLVPGPPPEDLAVPAALPLGHISGLPMALCSVPRPLHTHWCCQALPSPRQERHRCWHPQVGAADVEPCGNNSCLLPAVMQTRGPSGAFVSVAKAHGGKGPRSVAFFQLGLCDASSLLWDSVVCFHLLRSSFLIYHGSLFPRGRPCELQVSPTTGSLCSVPPAPGSSPPAASVAGRATGSRQNK